MYLVYKDNNFWATVPNHRYIKAIARHSEWDGAKVVKFTKQSRKAIMNKLKVGLVEFMDDHPSGVGPTMTIHTRGSIEFASIRDIPVDGENYRDFWNKVHGYDCFEEQEKEEPHCPPYRLNWFWSDAVNDWVETK